LCLKIILNPSSTDGPMPVALRCPAALQNDHSKPGEARGQVALFERFGQPRNVRRKADAIGVAGNNENADVGQRVPYSIGKIGTRNAWHEMIRACKSIL
jgi:hypothetical protein